MMDYQIFIGLLLTVLPFFELRGGLPVIIDYVLKNNLSIWPYFLLVLILNILVIFIIFLFLDFLHESFMKFRWYRKVIGKFLNGVQKKAHKVEKSIDAWGYLALMVFVAIPLPGTGAWTGTFISWMLGLN